MVHLSTVDHPDHRPSVVEGLEHLKVQVPEETSSATVYGSKFACEGLPHDEMPNCEMYPPNADATTPDGFERSELTAELPGPRRPRIA